ncbi:MAG: efflux RND transporter periplasmic adaptor subunit [Planctomycetota bacterium]
MHSSNSKSQREHEVMYQKRITLVGLSFFLIAVGPAIAQTPVRVADVRLEVLQQRQKVTGSLRAIARGDLAALESGRLVELTVREGDRVSKGDVVAKVDDRRLRAEHSELKADLRVAEAELERQKALAKQATANLARAERLIMQKAVSHQELDQYRAESEVAIAEVDAARRRIERSAERIRLLEIRLSDTSVVAPYDAGVVARHVEPGDWVQPGDKLLTLVSTGPMEARLEVPERFAADLIDATGVVVRSSALDRPLRVLETKRLDDVNPRVRTIQVIAIVENPDAALAAGMSIEGYVPSGQEEEFLTVPKDAIVRRSGQPTVFVVDESSAAKQVSVNVVFETRTRVAVVSSGLNEGASVVVEGNERLIPSQLVRVIDKTLEVTGSIASR